MLALQIATIFSPILKPQVYRTQAEMCHQMARMTVSPFKEGWLEFADEWTKLAREQQEKAKRADSEMAAGGHFPRARCSSVGAHWSVLDNWPLDISRQVKSST
jgi:hypothetical protein